MNDSVIQFEGTIYENGYGLLAQKVMRDKSLPKQAKLIYAYMCSFASVGKDGERTAFPSVSLQCNELGMSEDTYYKWRKHLEKKGYIKITKQRKEGAKFDRNIYSIVAVPVEKTEEKPYPKNSGTGEPYPKNSGTEKPGTEKQGTNIIRSLSLPGFKEEEEKELPLHEQLLIKFLQKKQANNETIEATIKELRKQNITDFSKEDLEKQFDNMLKEPVIWDFAIFFVGGLKKITTNKTIRLAHLSQKEEKRANRQNKGQETLKAFSSFING